MSTRNACKAIGRVVFARPCALDAEISLWSQTWRYDPLLTDLPMPVPALKRRLEIAQLVRILIQRVEGLAPASAVFDLANSLASLMDEMQGRGHRP